MISKDELLKAVFEAGVVGAGGAGFPTHVKLKADDIDTYVINGVECEPLLFKDKHLMREESQFLVDTAREVAEAIGAKRAVFVLKEKYKKEIESLRKAGGEVIPIRDYYPAGDEVILIREALGRLVPEGGLPLMVGVVVNNVETLYNLGRAMDSKSVTHKFVTVSGYVKEPGVWLVPVGVHASSLINACGGVTIEDPWYIDGGPMTGKYRKDLDFVVSKTTSGIIVVPGDSALVKYETMPVEIMLKQAKYACIQCNQCTLVCSRKLVGYDLKPHMIMRAMAYNKLADISVLKSAFLCSECNLCSGLHACPMQLSPRRVNQQLKAILRQQGVKPEFQKREMKQDPMRDYRLLPSSRLKRRIGLDKFPEELPFRGIFKDFNEVFVPFLQHIGRPCASAVSEGDFVAAGQVLGFPPEGALGAAVHSSIDGVVLSVTAEGVKIKKVDME